MLSLTSSFFFFFLYILLLLFIMNERKVKKTILLAVESRVGWYRVETEAIWIGENKEKQHINIKSEASSSSHLMMEKECDHKYNISFNFFFSFRALLKCEWMSRWVSKQALKVKEPPQDKLKYSLIFSFIQMITWKLKIEIKQILQLVLKKIVFFVWTLQFHFHLTFIFHKNDVINNFLLGFRSLLLLYNSFFFLLSSWCLHCRQLIYEKLLLIKIFYHRP
jgi:hypothetical protein